MELSKVGSPDDKIVFYYRHEQDEPSPFDYLYFGYWIDAPADSASDYDMGILAGGPGLAATIPSVPIERMEGTAHHSGPATGQFAMFEASDPGTITDAGQFTARVTLEARFGPESGDEALDDPFSISGSITDFRKASGTLIPEWSVTLESTGFERMGGGAIDSAFGAGSPGARPPEEDRNARTYDGQPAADKGWFEGQLVGDLHPDDGAPQVAWGAFGANFRNGRATGAFGATRQDPPGDAGE